MFCFYVSYKDKTVIITDFIQSKIKKLYGNSVELLNSVKNKESIEIVKPRVLRNFQGFKVVEQFNKPKYVMTEAHKQAIISALKGKPKSEEIRKKFSEAGKGRSNFKGKKHSPETKRLIGAHKIGNQHNKDLIWAFNPETGKELKVKNRNEIPEGYSQGRDYYSTEPGLYEMNSKG